ncbi:MAG: T9SS type A sorting domain-containing protein [Chitinophagaceae bacterium]|nr:T9SS type A sorting domain-containing protein [Chitinophagaceae bacterium]
MLKRNLTLVLTLMMVSLVPSSKIHAQCGIGYTQAQANWDYLDYYYNSGPNVAPYGYRVGMSNFNFVSNGMEQSQNFALGPNKFTIATSAAGMVKGDNAMHTGDIAGYTGNDAQFLPSGAGQTITITFNAVVMNANFTLYDVDRGAVFTVSAADAAAAPLAVTAVPQGPTILTIAGAPFKTISDLTNTNLANTDNRGTVTINVAGPVKTIVIAATTLGADANFWLSDINACVTGTFPTNWHQTLNNQPFTGPTQNQPDYFLITPDNNSTYMMDPATGNVYFLFTDAAKTYVNSFAYDATNKFLYYISENVSLDRTNKQLKKYDFNTNTISVVLADVSATLGFPTFNAGVESASAAFYNDNLYLGIEGGQFDATNSRESIVFRVEFDASHNPIAACQVFATPSYNGSTIVHDWADILVKDGALINYNSAKNTNYVQSNYTHFNLMTGAATVYSNPIPGSKFSGQAGLNYSGNMFMIYDSVWDYNAGVISNRKKITKINIVGDPASPAWTGNAGDGSDPFRPKCDFGDAPATFDPNPVSPAVHERSELVRIGATWDREWLKRGVSGTDDVDDGIFFMPFLAPGIVSYTVQVSVFNNNGTPATLCAWLDYNNNHIFDASEGITPIAVPSSGVSQNFYLYWPLATNSFAVGDSTWMRVRITSASAGMTASHPTGYFMNGEVEDYKLYVDNYPLAASNLQFNAALISNSYAKLNWTVTEDHGSGGYEIEKSNDSRNWTMLGLSTSDGTTGNKKYEYTDPAPFAGITYYRLKLLGVSGNNKYSEVRSVKKLILSDMVSIRPNPATTVATIGIESTERTDAVISIIGSNGKQLYEKKVLTNIGQTLTEIPVRPDWATGVYVVRVQMYNETVNKKLIIQKK